MKNGLATETSGREILMKNGLATETSGREERHHNQKNDNDR